MDATGQLLDRARSGDGEAFAELTGVFRRELQVHCYRILGSAADAEDMLQETMMAAWRGLDRFEGRASLRTWLHAIATNKCLNHLRAARALPAYTPEVPLPGSAREHQVTTRFADAFERGDVEAIVALLTDDAWLTMPPLPFEYHGRGAVGHFLDAVSFRPGNRRSRLVPTRANGQPAFARYLPDPHVPVGHARGLLVLTLAGDRICGITGFIDNSVLGRFGLPRTLPE